jgi:hypothetical protein
MNIGGDLRKMEDIAKATGGTYHEVTKNGQLESLLDVFRDAAQAFAGRPAAFRVFWTLSPCARPASP